MTRVVALRGATTVTANDADAILDATEELLRAVMERNVLTPQDVISVVFTLTEDLDATFPAQAARRIGFEAVPLLCAREIPVPNSLPRVIRLLAHVNGSQDARPEHVYLREAVKLRQDIAGAQ